MRRSFLLPFLFFTGALLLNSSSYAQGSPYYFLGFGDPITPASSRIMGLAGGGVALTDGSIINQLNPAALTSLPRTTFDVGLRYAYDKAQQSGIEGVNRLFKFNGLNAGTLLWNEAKLSVGFGLNPVSDAEAETERVDSLGAVVHKSEGGLSQFSLGVAARPFSALALGARVDFLFGNIRTLTQVNFDGEDVTAGLFQRDYSLSGTRATIGLQLLLDSLFPELRGLTIGIAYSTAATLTSTERTTPVLTTLDTTIEAEGSGYYPAQIRIGLAGRFGDRYRVEADIIGQDFSTAYVFAPNGTTSSGDPSLGSANSYSFSLERLPLLGDEGRGYGFWERAGLRLGASYSQLPFRPAAGVTVSELAGSLGLGIPFANGSSIDIAAQLGIRTPSNTDIAPKELFFKIGTTVTISERWFVPLRKTDDD